MNKTGTIISFEPKGSVNLGDSVKQKYFVTFKDGNKYSFLANNDWLHPIGTEISFIVSNADAQPPTAKGAKRLEANNFQSKSTNSVNPLNGVKLDIILQVCYKENMQAFAKENRQSVIDNTKQDFISLIEILKNQ